MEYVIYNIMCNDNRAEGDKNDGTRQYRSSLP